MLALGMVALVLSQAKPEAPAVCLQVRITDSVEAVQKRLLASDQQLTAIAFSRRKDVRDDIESATDFHMYVMDLFDITLHFNDLAINADLSTDKETKHRIRRRLVYILQVVRLRIDSLTASLNRNSAYVTLPVLANDVKELRSTLAALEEGIADCIVGTKLPEGVKVE